MPITTGAVFDTNVVFSALWSRHGASWRLLDLVLDERLTLHLTVPLVLEYEEVLLRKQEALGITRRDVMKLLAALVKVGRWHKVYYLWRWHVRDPDDAHVLEAASAASCPHLVTFNTKDFTDAGQLGVRVLTPAEFLQAI